jgi:hypothetical protein
MAHRTVNSHCSVHTGQSGALFGPLSGAPLKFISETGALGFLRGETLPLGQPGPTWQRAHRTVRFPKARNPIFCFYAVFNSVFVLTCVYVLECHLALYVSVNMHQHYTRTLLVKLLIDNPSL